MSSNAINIYMGQVCTSIILSMQIEDQATHPTYGVIIKRRGFQSKQCWQ